MSIKTKLIDDIKQFQPGTIFTYQELPTYQSAPNTVVKTVSRLIKTGELRRFSKGNFYRPKSGLFGEQKPSDQEKIKTFLFRNGRRIGYITGISLYNKLGLTTQIPIFTSKGYSRRHQAGGEFGRA